MAKRDELSAGGSRILRHEGREHDEDVAELDEGAREALERHLTKFIGAPEQVFHEIVSGIVHIDILVIPPAPERDWYTLVTSGMSDLPMTPPEDCEDNLFAELMLSLPSNWAPGDLLDRSNLENEDIFWPIGLLRNLAGLPHEHETWLSWGHTIPNGDPPRPYADNTALCGALLMTPISVVEDGFEEVFVRPDKIISLYSVVPLYESEMELKLAHGIEPLVNALDAVNVSELLEPKRRVARHEP